MKKSILYITSLTAALISLPACSDDFLDTVSKKELNTETFYKTEADAEMALIGCYDGWQSTVYNGAPGFYLASEMLSDHCFGGAGVGDARNWQVLDRFDQSESSSDNDIFNDNWTEYYKAIYRCNELIAHESQITWASEAAQGRIMGECRTIRALLYFDLTRLFGDVPLFTEPVNENRPRTAAAEVYKVIVEDLNYASKNIPANAYPLANNSATDGRITKFAAEALLARVYLFYSGYYGVDPEGCTKADALAAVEDVIANGGYQLEASYADLWMPACTKSADSEYSWITTYAGKYCNADGWHAGQTGISKEIILNQKFNTTGDYNGNNDGNVFQVYLGIRNTNCPPYAVGWGCCTVNPYFVNKFGGDPRVSASVIDYNAIGFESKETFSLCLNDSRDYTGYAVKKYSPLCFYDGVRESVGLELGEMHQNISYYIDYTIMRYSDVLLMAAELGSSNAQSYYDQVRKRAGMATKAVTTQNILDEREVEFAFEGIRYWDVLRQGLPTAAATIAEHQNGVKVKNAGNEDLMTTAVGNITAKKGLQQIPARQISLSSNVLTQNDGWK